MSKLICPDCGSDMILRVTKKFTYSNGQPRKFYGCSNWPNCTATHGAHPDGKPLGIPGDNRTKKARIIAHKYFDRIHSVDNLNWTKKKAYWLLRTVMDMSRKEAHIAKFDVEQCMRLVKRLRETILRKDYAEIEAGD